MRSQAGVKEFEGAGRHEAQTFDSNQRGRIFRGTAGEVFLRSTWGLGDYAGAGFARRWDRGIGGRTG